MAYKLKLKVWKNIEKQSEEHRKRKFMIHGTIVVAKDICKRVNFVSLPVRRNVSNFRRISMKKDTATLN